MRFRSSRPSPTLPARERRLRGALSGQVSKDENDLFPLQSEPDNHGQENGKLEHRTDIAQMLSGGDLIESPGTRNRRSPEFRTPESPGKGASPVNIDGDEDWDSGEDDIRLSFGWETITPVQPSHNPSLLRRSTGPVDVDEVEDDCDSEDEHRFSVDWEAGCPSETFATKDAVPDEKAESLSKMECPDQNDASEGNISPVETVTAPKKYYIDPETKTLKVEYLDQRDASEGNISPVKTVAAPKKYYTIDAKTQTPMVANDADETTISEVTNPFEDKHQMDDIDALLGKPYCISSSDDAFGNQQKISENRQQDKKAVFGSGLSDTSSYLGDDSIWKGNESASNQDLGGADHKGDGENSTDICRHSTNTTNDRGDTVKALPGSDSFASSSMFGDDSLLSEIPDHTRAILRQCCDETHSNDPMRSVLDLNYSLACVILIQSAIRRHLACREAATRLSAKNNLSPSPPPPPPPPPPPLFPSTTEASFDGFSLDSSNLYSDDDFEKLESFPPTNNDLEITGDNAFFGSGLSDTSSYWGDDSIWKGNESASNQDLESTDHKVDDKNSADIYCPSTQAMNDHGDIAKAPQPSSDTLLFGEENSLLSQIPYKHTRAILRQCYDKTHISDPMYPVLDLNYSLTCVILIQAAARRYLAYRETAARISAIAALQALFRRRLALKLKETRMQSVLVIQSFYRGCYIRGRLFHPVLLLLEDRAARVIQSFFQRNLAQIRWHSEDIALHRGFYKQIWAVSTMQSAFRAWKTRATFLRKKSAAKTIQALYRGTQIRIWQKSVVCNNAATAIQAIFRGCRARGQHLLEQTGVTNLCRTYRSRLRSAAWTIRYKYRILVSAYGTKSPFRCWLMFVRQNVAAKAIQTCYRQHSACVQLLQMQSAATTIQKVVRGHLATIEVCSAIVNSAAVNIQRVVRGHLAAVKVYTVIMTSTVAIQSAFRGYLARKLFLRKRSAALTIQSIFRMGQAQDHFFLARVAATEVQRVFRGYLSTVRVYEDIYRVTMVQSIVRRKLCSDHAIARMINIIIVQSVARGFLSRLPSYKFNQAALKIQTRWRSHRCQFNYQLDVLDITLVQSIFRRKFCKVPSWQILKRMECVKTGKIDVFRLQAAALKIQTKWRSYVCRYHYEQDLLDIILVQSICRRWLCATTSWWVQNKKVIAEGEDKALDKEYLQEKSVSTDSLDKLMDKEYLREGSASSDNLNKVLEKEYQREESVSSDNLDSCSDEFEDADQF